jgi:hypothetical protein
LNIGVIGMVLQSNRQVLRVDGVTALQTNGDSIVWATNNAAIAGTQVQPKPAAGRTIHRKRMVLEIFPLDFGLRGTRKA